MGLKDALRGFFLMPTSRPDGAVRCVTHDRVFEGWMEASFHQTLNLDCRFESVRPQPSSDRATGRPQGSRP